MQSFFSTRVLFVLWLASAVTWSGVWPVFGHEFDAGHVVLGDSIEAGFGASSEDHEYVNLFHDDVEAFFGAPADLHNLAEPGATLRDIRHDQLASAVAEIEDHGPVVVSLGGGGNDLRTFIASPEAVTCTVGQITCLNRLDALLNELEAALDVLLKKVRSALGPEGTIIVRTQYNPLRRAGCDPDGSLALLADIVLEGQVPPFLIRGLNDRIRALAAKYRARVADIYVPFLWEADALIDADCIHPTDDGHAVIRTAFETVLH